MRTIIPEHLWIGDSKKYEKLIDEWFSKDVFTEDEEEKLIAKMVKELKDEPLVLEFLEIY